MTTAETVEAEVVVTNYQIKLNISSLNIVGNIWDNLSTQLNRI